CVRASSRAESPGSALSVPCKGTLSRRARPLRARPRCVCFSGRRLMNRVALFSLVLAWALALCPHTAVAQYVGDPSESRATRFLLAMAERRAPVPVDLKRSWVLRQPLSLALDGVTLKEALAEISRQARLHLVYAVDAVPIAATVNLRADRITV